MNTPTIDVDPSDNQATPVTAEVSIIIVNWNSRDFVRQCLASLYRHTSGFAFEVIVVDGASYDGCKEMLEAEFSSVRFVQCEKNVGFARANNLGAEQAQGTTLLFLNPDTELLDDAPADLVRILRSTPEAGLVGCRLLNSDRSVQTSCVQALPTVFNQFFDSEYLRSRFPHWRTWGTVSLQIGSGEPMVVQAVSGACMTIARSDFVAVGGFTPSYFMYGEDLDLCLKIARAGKRVLFSPSISIIHHGGGSTKQGSSKFSNVMMRESVYRFMRINHGAFSALAYRIATAVSAAIRLALILPLLAIGGGVVRHGIGSLGKWYFVLRWSLGLESWVHRHP